MTPDWPFPKPKLDRVQKLVPASRRRASVRTTVAKKEKGSLSTRQIQVMDLICSGKMLTEIADIIGISRNTVEVHLYRARNTIGAGGRRLHVAIARYCILRAGLRLPLRNAGMSYVDADGKTILASQMADALHAVAEVEA